MSPSHCFLGCIFVTVASTTLVGQDHAFIESSQTLLQLPADSDHSNVSVTVVALAPNGASIAIGASDGTVRILPVAEGSAPTTIAKLDHSVEATDGKLLAVTSYFSDDELPAFSNIQVCDAATGKSNFSSEEGPPNFRPMGKCSPIVVSRTKAMVELYCSTLRRSYPRVC